ncbi:hypothetical protein Pla123a_21940 [Posidoniimonas polymericola]|uniref:ABC-type transport auxiliary lipoprotein component domain-containing protein n=1 Tax=Posidoniimonas polymericola TaxID=2528002 RepID=A0A5C5YRT0_9BACT|nr:hypothetical protein [Posidoniimonas polymericola]TWT77533.1 hypothetical protein Pla123a_21940 [Posidoniimonas polymericola]
MPLRTAIWLIFGLLACGNCGAVPAESFELTYASPTDRLNVASGGDLLPAASRCVLRVESPHPAGTPGVARATLVVERKVAQPGWWARRFGAEPAAVTPTGAWVTDLPASEAQNLLATLDRERFYLRSRPLGAEVQIGVRRDGERFAKEFRPLAEFDALVLRVRRHGVDPRDVAADAPDEASQLSGGLCRRLPALEPARR